MRVAALVLGVLCLSAPFLALAEEGHGSHGSSLAQKLQSYLKKTAEARGSMKLEESPEHTALMTRLKEKTDTAIGRVFGKMKADTTTTTGAHRSLLQSNDFKFATSSDGCKNTLKDLGITDIATQVDGKTSVDIAAAPKYTDCVDYLENILFDKDNSVGLKDFCSKTCKDDAVYWVGAYTSTCVVDALQFYVDSEFNKEYSSKLSQMSDADKALYAFLIIGGFSTYTSAETMGISTLVGCNTMGAGSTCASKSWWYDVAGGDTVDNTEEDPSSGIECDATGKSGDYIVPCRKDWKDICDPFTMDTTMTQDCCYTSGVVLANALEVLAECPFQKVYQDVFKKFGFPWPECSKDEIEFKCGKDGRTKYLTGMEGQPTKCCEEISVPISAVCPGASIADQVNKYAEGKTAVTAGAAATKATLFIVVALATVNWLGLL